LFDGSVWTHLVVSTQAGRASGRRIAVDLRENIAGVTDESLGGGTSVEVPETEGVVPRSREGELTC
jgi:hypothetical protein